MYYKKDFRYQDADFYGEYNEKMTKARDWLADWQNKTNNLFICGSVGCGKTYLIMAFLNELTKDARFVPPYGKNSGFWDLEDVDYTVSKNLFDTMKRKFSTNAEVVRNAKDQLYTWFNTKLLIIDEFGLGYDTESEQIELTELLDYRWKKGLPTVFVSNLGMKAIGEYLKDRARQRAFDGASYIEIKSETLRNKPKEL